MHHPPVVPQGELTNTLVVMEFFHLFFIRNLYGTSLTWRTVRGTPAVWLTVATVTLAQVAITYVPWLQVVFDTRAVPLADGVLIIGVGVALFVIIAIEKQVRLAFANRAAPAGAGCA
jgi:magnesium-transporting ATPase (P-type)